MSEQADAFKAAHLAIAWLEEDFKAGRVTWEDVRETLVNVAAAATNLRRNGIPGRFEPKMQLNPKTEKFEKKRGTTKSISSDNAHLAILASLPKHGGSVGKAVEAFYGNDVKFDLKSEEKQIYRIMEFYRKQGADPVFVALTLIDGD